MKRGFFKLKIAISLIVAALPIIANVWAWIRTPKDFYFLGVNNQSNLHDIFGVYFPAIRDYASDGFLFYNPYTQDGGEFFHLPVYFLLGKAARLTGLSPEIIYNLGIFVASFIFCFFLFNFVGIFFHDNKKLLIAFSVVVFGGLLAIGIPEGSVFWSLWEPHFVLSQLTFLGSLYLIFQIRESPSSKSFILLFASTLILSSIHPWMAAFLGFLCLFFWAYLFGKKKQNRNLLWALFTIGLASLPFFVYYLIPQKVYWSSFPLKTSPFLLFWHFGLILPFALYGSLLVLRKKYPIEFAFLAIWLIIQIVFLYLPFPFQRRFMEGIYFPVGILALVGIDPFIRRLPKIVYLKELLMFFFLIGTLALYLFLYVWIPNKYIYRPKDEKNAWQFLHKTTDGQERLLSMPSTGTIIPSQARIKLFVGHGIQTPQFARKERFAKSYYSGEISVNERESLLKKENICLVYLGSEEKGVARVEFGKEGYLKKIYENNLVTIYKTTWCL